MNAAARIGPNAITRVAEALIVGGGPDLAQRVFERAGLTAYLREPPGQMVDESEVTRLHRELRGLLGAPAAAAVAREAADPRRRAAGRRRFRLVAGCEHQEEGGRGQQEAGCFHRRMEWGLRGL